jgi:hypothetical protein
VIRVGGVTTVVVATATAACGLLMLSGAGPAPAAADHAVVEPAAEDARAAAGDVEAPATTEPTTEPTTLAVVADSTSTTTAPAPPIPLSVTPTSITVGLGGTARITGECPIVDGAPLGPVQIWQIGSIVTPIATGVTSASWSYDWSAPSEVAPLVLQVWCGDPSQYRGGYPESLLIEVVFVAQAAPTTTAPPVLEPPHEIPETG